MHPRAVSQVMALCGLNCQLLFFQLRSSGGGAFEPVQGKVFYQNQPLHGAVVTFHPKGGAKDLRIARPIGLTGEDGTFTLTTEKHEGAPAGEYVVTVICPQPVAPKSRIGFSTEPPDSRDRFRGAYANPAKSQLKVVIKNGANQLEPFRLK